jgi:hypothetical protein
MMNDEMMKMYRRGFENRTIYCVASDRCFPFIFEKIKRKIKWKNKSEHTRNHAASVIYCLRLLLMVIILQLNNGCDIRKCFEAQSVAVFPTT